MIHSLKHNQEFYCLLAFQLRGQGFTSQPCHYCTG